MKATKSSQKTSFQKCFTILLFPIVFFNIHVEAQDYSRFMKVKGWKINYEIIKKGIEQEPSDKEIPAYDYDDKELPEYFDNETITDIFKAYEIPFKAAETDIILRTTMALSDLFLLMDYKLKLWNDLKGYSISMLVSNSNVNGNCIFNKKVDEETWSGTGSIKYNFDEKSAGYLLGSKFYGVTVGSGQTKLYDDESFFSINPGNGTFELLLIPGNEESTGMKVQIHGENKMWEDIIIGVKKEFGADAAETAVSGLPDLLEKNKPEITDAIDALSDRYFIFSL
ncbi:MAG TPA: hypothetical protein VLA03_10950, partial [Draconibacterium sp.]|nr:hypothetical protein [Draconibacterium sp.]